MPKKKMVYRSNMVGPRSTGRMANQRSTVEINGNHAAHTNGADHCRRGRRLRWQPRLVSQEDLERSQKFAEEYLPKGKTRARIVRFYTEFASINGLPREDPATLLACIGQMLSSSLAAGTIKDYVKFILQASLLPRSRNAFDILSACDKAHADHDTTSATPFTSEELWDFLAQVQEHKTFFLLMAITGWRYIDICRLRRGQIKLLIRDQNLNHEYDTLMIQARWTKTIKKRAHRRTVFFPLGDANGFNLTTAAKDDILFGDPKEKFLYNTPYHQVMRLIKNYSPNRSTYSIRYHFISWALTRCNGNLEQVAQRYTLHRDASMLNAFYVQWSGAASLFEY